MTSLWPGVVADDGALIPSSLFQDALMQRGPQPDNEYREYPIEWIEDVLGIPRETLVWSENEGYDRHKWDGTPDPLVALLEGLAQGKDVGVEAATGTQKSHTAACAIFWFLGCWKNAIVNTYAPKEDQLRLFIWKEIGELWPRFKRRFPTAELSDLRIRMNGSDKWAAHGIAVGVRADEKEGSATKAQGAHAPDMLIITEETPGVPAAIMTALRNTRTGKHNLQLSLGNPNDQQDTLHRFCVLPSVVHVRISAYDHPNVVTGRDVVPGAASPAGIARIAEEDEPGSPMYESRVRGISPAEATDSLIKLAWLHAAAARYQEELAKDGPRAIGVDVANSENGDKASKAYFRGAALERYGSEQCRNANRLGSDVVNEANELGVEPWHVGVDPVGVGAGTVNEMDRLGFHARRLGGGMSPIEGAERAPDGSSMDFAPDANRFLNLRSQMGWQLREDLRKGQLALPLDLKLFRQLTAIKYKVAGGKVILEEKEKVKARLGRSPDDFDSIMYGNWVRPRSAIDAPSDVGDDTHPGWDLKHKRKRPRTARVPEPGESLAARNADIDDDLRPGRWAGTAGFTPFKMPRMFGGGDDDE